MSGNSQDLAMTDYDCDFCIVGGGSAGCVVAARLTENPGFKVIVLEAGPRDWHPFVHIPAACLFLQHDPRFNWLDQTIAQTNLGGREIRIPQGRLLGGSGSINGMLHVRPQVSDIDGWGTEGWSYDDLMKVGIQAEDFSEGGPLRGEGGPHPVTGFVSTHLLAHAFVTACEGVGIPFNPDMNGPDRGGAAFFQQNRKGRFRSQPAQSYLRRARGRANLHILTGAICRKVMFEGRRATGVVYFRDGREYRLRVRREVILSAGALRSPQILQVSGIGNPAELARIGVPVVAGRNAVGRNLRDHFLLRLSHRVGGVETINERARGFALLRELAHYVFRGGGALTMGAGAAAAIIPSGLFGKVPDLQLSFAPGSFAGPGRLEKTPGMTIGGWLSPARSKGTVMARSADTRDRPLIDPNYLDDPVDRAGIIACTRMIRRIFDQPALKRWSLGETFPGPETGNGEDEILGFARQSGASGYHFAGTCRMGDDPDSVVDGRLRVRDVQGLRVIDASVMPLPPIGNAHATVVMTAEKGARIVADDARHHSG
ncbi:MAG: GMC family oxidoreductase [Pseudorhodobacter sp.]